MEPSNAKGRKMTALETEISWLALKWLGIWSIIAALTIIIVFAIITPGGPDDEPRRKKD